MPSDYEAREHIDNEGDVGEARQCTNVGQVGHPQAVRDRRAEVSLHQVSGPVKGIVRHSCTPGFPSHRSREPQFPHQALHGATRCRDTLAMQLPPHLAGAVDAKVVCVYMPDLHLQRIVPNLSQGWRATTRCVVGRRGEPQHPADRLDPETIPVDIYEAGHLGGLGSSSCAKKTDAAFRISLALRNSRFSRSSTLSRSRSSVVCPRRVPESTSARRIHLRSVSAVMPHLPAIDAMAAHSDVYSSRCSCTRRTVRSRTSGGYLFDLVITPSSQGLESPTFPGRFTTSCAVWCVSEISLLTPLFGRE